MTRLRVMAIAGLTAVDYGLTYLGIQRGYLVEGNPLLVEVMRNPMQVLFLFAVMCGAFYVLYKAAQSFRWASVALSVIVAVKVLVVGMHLHGLMA